MENNQSKTGHALYPSTSLAYDVAIKCYDQAILRYEAGQQSLTGVVNWATTLTAAFLAFSVQLRLPMDSFFFITGIALYVLSVSVALFARNWSGVLTLDPAILYERDLGKDTWEFQKDMIYWSGESNHTNTFMLKRKWQCSVVAQALLCAEMFSFSLWALYRP